MNSLTKHFLRIAVTVALVQGWFFATSPATFAAETTFTPELNIPGQFSGPQTVDENLFGRYVRAIYVYFIWTVGVVATGMVIYAGVKWVAAAGNQAKIKDARDMITNAIIGVIIGLTSVVLLNLLSPSFTTLQIPQLTQAKKNYFVGAAATDLCGRQEQVDCGQLKETGDKVTDPQGKEVPEYCMGTQCKVGTVCALSVNTYPGEGTPLAVYVPAAGCVASIPLGPTQPTEYSGITSLAIDEFYSECGKITQNKTKVGGSCHENVSDKKGICYIALTPAQAVDLSSGDILRKMTCPSE